MSLLFLNKESSFILLERFFSIKNESHDLKPLSEIFHALQNENFADFIVFLKDNDEIRKNFVYYIKNVFLGKRFNLSLTEANILSEDSFFPELKKRLLSKILPPAEDENTVSYIISNVFFRDSADFKFIKKISRKQADELFRLLEIDNLLSLPKVKKELLFSMNILTKLAQKKKPQSWRN